MRLNDAHLHFADPDRLGELERYLHEAQVRRIAAASLPDAARIHFNPEVLYAKLRLSPRCYGFASLDYSARLHPELFPGEAAGPDLAAQVDRLRAAGFDGLKLFLGKPAFQQRVSLRLDDPPVAQALERAATLELPALIHVADPPVFWTRGPLTGSAGPTYEELQAQALAVLDGHPRLTVVFAHLLMMAHDLPRLAGTLSAYPNAHVDLAPGLYFYAELDRRAEEARAFLLRFRERVLFGSDGFWFPPDYDAFAGSSLADNLQRARRLAEFLAGDGELENPFPYTQDERPRLRGLGLGRSREGRLALRNILRDNFRRLFPASPVPVDAEACARYTEGVAERALRLAVGPAGGRTVGPAVGYGRDQGEPLAAGTAPETAARRAEELVRLAARFRGGLARGAGPSPAPMRNPPC
jgi:predicted TIM-barrel fold metal-dependent hydrolase